jgi:hypothetical protein
MQFGDEPAPYEAYSHFWHPVLLGKDGFYGSVSFTALTNSRRRSKMKIRYVTSHKKFQVLMGRKRRGRARSMEVRLRQTGINEIVRRHRSIVKDHCHE